ncbi:PQQ-binding-like beta-propeller repeat protein [Elizabethkingia ursingii]|uniref:Pyrrolo-quinoline quinone repeat domain-containing protein n=1 Tax=Elizabethkingia ursingii TaxID=1756150 RepID=A0ABX3N8B1_9FLAO|nr:PQQ-binding-like beta-propeller repeat protein [Elizabethkingia ursingii]MCL1665719.1 PQQ-binding-like beta-propeller repeat protein [Elizabethkingia ursingii]OPB88823.1 hypothetical protein BB021_05470 [Elizabethkingia ursingii]
MKKLLLLPIILQALSSCNNTPSAEPTKTEHTTLIVATQGSIYNFDLDKNKITWQYNSPMDSTGNRNLFTLDGQNIFMPFESGKLINFDVNTGKIIWKQQIDGNEDSPMDVSDDANQQNQKLQSIMPLFMSQPLVDGQNIIMASTGQPETTNAWLYNFNRTTGKKTWASSLPTVFNLYAPVKYRNNYFVNTAVYLEMYTPQTGTPTSYGMFDGDVEVAGQPLQHHDVSQFEYPIYNQMQTDGKNLYIGDEKGKFYCLNLDKDANLPNSDISDPNNTFIKNPKVFKWIFKDEHYSFAGDAKSFMEDGTLYTVLRDGVRTESCIFAIDTDNGKTKWKQVIKADIMNWSTVKDKIIGNTENTIFYMDANGKNFIEVKIQNKPLSNIEPIDKTHFIYATQKGIEIFDTDTKTAKLVIGKSFKYNQHNNLQIKYISK